MSMDQDATIAALAKVIVNLHDQNKSALEMAGAMLALCGPKPLAWEQIHVTLWVDSNRAYAIICQHSADLLEPFAVLGYDDHGVDVHVGNRSSLEEAKQCAQDHAVAAHWAATLISNHVGVV